MRYHEAGVRDIEDGKIEFTVLPEHVRLLRHSRVFWNPAGVGAPMIDPETPYGRAALLEAMQIVLDNFDLEDAEAMVLHKGTAVALAIAIQCGKWKPGVYRADKYQSNWTEYRPPKPKKEKKTDVTDGDDDGESPDDEAAVLVRDGTQPALDLQ